GYEPESELAAPLGEALDDDRRAELEARVERLARRREQLGPVNPLAKREYEDAVAHVEELESQRSDLETALAELEGLIRETDRRIRQSFEETFEATARNFEEVVSHLFPGGRARVPVRRVPRAALPVLHPRRGRGRARRREHRPLPDSGAALLRAGPVHRGHAPEADDGRRRLPLRREHGWRRRLEGHLAAVAPGGGRGASAALRADGGRRRRRRERGGARRVEWRAWPRPCRMWRAVST